MTKSQVTRPVAHELKRSLGYWDLIVYGLAYIAPFAPLATLGFVWQASNGLIVLVYLLGGACMYFTAKSYAVMSETFPTAGSVYGFARHSLGPLPGFLAGWMILLDYLLIPSFVYVLIAVALGTLVQGVDRAVWIVVLVLFTLGVNWFGVTITTRANCIAVGLQVLMLLVLLGFAVVALLHGKGTGGLTLKPVFEADRLEVGRIFRATSICIMSFLGFDAISTLAEEVEGQDRRIAGRAIVGVLVISTAFFVLVTWVLGNLMPGIVMQDPAAAVYELLMWSVGAWASVALAWAYATVVGLSNALPMQVGVARVLYAMGRDRQLPHALASVHPRYHTPHIAMLVSSAISLAVALVMRNMLDELATIVNFGALSGFLLLHVSVLRHFAFRQRSNHWFAHWMTPVLGIAVVSAVLSGMSGLAAKVGLAWLAVGIFYGLVLHVRLREITPRQAGRFDVRR